MYSSATNQVKKTVSRFKEAAYSGCFRHDGRLLAAGSEEGVVKVEDYHVDVATHPHNTSLVTSPCAPPGEKRSGERSRISWAYYSKAVRTNEIARSVIIT